ncbi:MAG: uracil-DNA glycosylase [Kiritimatiellia bacterium]
MLNDIKEYLEYQLDEGVRGLELSAGPPGAVEKRGPGRAERLEAVARRAEKCSECGLRESRNRVVPGEGSTDPDIMFVGEAPGAREDMAGRPFVGAAGKLLTKMIEAMGYTRQDVFIGNILKCRPPGNRTPSQEEMEICRRFLREQIAVLRPRVIVTMGATALKGLLDVSGGITRLRGKWFLYEGIDVMPTYHPAYLLRNPAAKKDVWEDLKAVLKRLGRVPPPLKSRGKKDQ